MTELYDRKAYNQAHKKLKNNAVRPSVSLPLKNFRFLALTPIHLSNKCGLASLPPNYDWKLCDLGMHETIDTRLQLKMGEEGSGNKSKHWAYAPGLSLSKSAWTPKVSSGSFFYKKKNSVFILSVESGSCSGQSRRLHKGR